MKFSLVTIKLAVLAIQNNDALTIDECIQFAPRGGSEVEIENVEQKQGCPENERYAEDIDNPLHTFRNQ